jgi:hypothetical protein
MGMISFINVPIPEWRKPVTSEPAQPIEEIAVAESEEPRAEKKRGRPASKKFSEV